MNPLGRLTRICWQLLRRTPRDASPAGRSYTNNNWFWVALTRIARHDRGGVGDFSLTTFSALNLSPRLLETLAAQGYETPTPIQAQSIPVVLDGADLLGCAQTGTGKTAAFSLPLIERLLASGRKGGKNRPRRARGLILAPTRELAGQIEASLQTYGQGTGLRYVVIYGGVSQNRQVHELRRGVDIIVATPGRLLDLMEQGHVDLHAVEMFVLDEADRMLDMGFIHPIRRIGSALPAERQTLLFSATMPPKIRQLADAMLRDPISVSVTPVASTAPLIQQTLYHVPYEHKPALLNHLLQDVEIVRTLVFTRTKHGADRLVKKLTRDGVTAGAIHGNKSQNQRQRALDAFRTGRSRVLVATDVAARGLDVDGITHVFNYDLPIEPEAYVHRIGRTGRAGATGQAISMCSRDERTHLYAIERLTGERIETTKLPDELGLPEEAFTESSRSSQEQETRRKPNPKPRRKSRVGHPKSADHTPTKNAPQPRPKRARKKKAAAGQTPSAEHRSTKGRAVSGRKPQGAGAGNRRRGRKVARTASRA